MNKTEFINRYTPQTGGQDYCKEFDEDLDQLINSTIEECAKKLLSILLLDVDIKSNKYADIKEKFELAIRDSK